MAKKITAFIKLQVPAAKATPAPPIGPALGQHGVNIPGFCKEFNARTQKDAGLIIPVVITVYSDRSFTFITKTPPAPVLIKKALNLETASGRPLRRSTSACRHHSHRHPSRRVRTSSRARPAAEAGTFPVKRNQPQSNSSPQLSPLRTVFFSPLNLFSKVRGSFDQNTSMAGGSPMIS